MADAATPENKATDDGKDDSEAGSAGLTYAPPYDPSNELDPKRVRAIQGGSFDLSRLEYFQQQAARRTLFARLLLLLVIFGMLFVNMWLTQRNYEHMLINLDETRSAQSGLEEVTWVHLRELKSDNKELLQRVGNLEAKLEAMAPVEQDEPETTPADTTGDSAPATAE